MAIKSKQVPMYTKHTLFYIFLIFHFFNKKKLKQNWKQTNKNMLNKVKYKTRRTQKQESKNKQVMINNRGRERVTKSLYPF